MGADDKDPKQKVREKLQRHVPRSKSARRGQEHVGFNVTARRAMPEGTVGEGGPGPGSYMPASTFGKFEMSSEKQKQRNRQTSSFRSKSLQRPRPQNELVPGPVVFSAHAVYKNVTNPGSSMKSKAKRLDAGSIEWAASQTSPNLGPGAYNSQTHKTIADKSKKVVKSHSKNQSAGFGCGSSRFLPFEEEIEASYKPYQGLPEPPKRSDAPGNSN